MRWLVSRGTLFLPASTTLSFLIAPGTFFSAVDSEPRLGDGGAELVFTKRCSWGSYTIEESRPKETARAPPLPSRIVREVRTGAVVATRPPSSEFRGGDFTVSHFCPAIADKIG
jgi:hypothetical protein